MGGGEITHGQRGSEGKVGRLRRRGVQLKQAGGEQIARGADPGPAAAAAPVVVCLVSPAHAAAWTTISRHIQLLME
jgi:hypothetical protein